MRCVIAGIVATCFLTGASGSRDITLTGPNREAMLQGETYLITWTTSESIESVNVVASGHNTPLGDKSRGDFVLQIAESVPSDQRQLAWKVPWIDARVFLIKIEGYDSTGQLIATAEREYVFRPRSLANRTKDGIYLDLSTRNRQRLYVQKNYKITHVYLSSSSETYLWLPPGKHIKTPHDHAGVFSVLEKKLLHKSKLFNVDMPYAMRYHGGHFIHATSPEMYAYLGQPASSGCNRLTLHDARELYAMTPLGTRVEVIGP
jgi:lipoprotein-anchoring transpeptidase ErfK/SrfK